MRSALLLGSVALVLTFSRSAWIAGGAGIGITYFVLGKKHGRNFMSSLVMALIFIVFTVLVVRGMDFSGESVVVRQQLNAAALTLWRQSPIIGVGLGNFLVQLPSVLPVRTIYFLQPVHNVYLMVLSEVGLIGLGIFLWIVYRAVTIRTVHVSPVFRISLLLLLLLGLVDHYAVTLEQGQLLLTVLLAVNLTPHS